MAAAASRRRGSSRLPGATAVQLPALLAVLLLLAAARPARPQQTMPFLGSGNFLPAYGKPDPVTKTPTQDVYVSTFLDRLLSVDDRAYTFEAVVFVYMSWRDPAAKRQITRNRNLLTAPNSTYECKQPCSSNLKLLASGCCDGLWTPYVAFTNVKSLSQDRMVRYGLGFNTEESKEGGDEYVFQWQVIHATWYTSMDLRAFPFDTQNLVIQMEVPRARLGWSGSQINLIPSTTGTRLFTAKEGGDELSGWTVTGITQSPFLYPLCRRFPKAASSPSHPDDPAPLVPEDLWEIRDGSSGPSQSADHPCVHRLAKTSVFWWDSLVKEYDPLMRRGSATMVAGLNVRITVDRLYSRYILSAIFPILATTWLGFMVFFLPREEMQGRVSVVVALFLALAAIQFVIDSASPASSYTTPMQQLTAASYATLLLLGLECLVIWGLTVHHLQKLRSQRHSSARRRVDERLQSTLDRIHTSAALPRPKQLSRDGRGVSWRHQPSSLRSMLRPKGGSALAESDSGPGFAEPAAAAGASAAALTPVPDGCDIAAAAAGGSDQTEGTSSRRPSSGSVKLGPAPGFEQDAGWGLAAQGSDVLLRLESLRRQQQQGSQAVPVGYYPSLAPLASPASAAQLPEEEELPPQSFLARCLPGLDAKLQLYKRALVEDDDFADHQAHLLNKWCGIVQFFFYNFTVALIFGLNAWLHRSH